MTVSTGLGLFFIGTLLTIIVLAIAFHIGSRPLEKKEQELNEAEKTILKLNNIKEL